MNPTTAKSQSAKRIIVTGGSGKLGRHVLEYLLSRGCQLLNLDISPPSTPIPGVHSVKVDLCDCGQVYSALTSHFRLTEPFSDPCRTPDAVIHLAGYSRNMLVPDNETFRANTIAAYNVVEACCRLGVRKIVLASSICVYGVTYAEGNVDFPSFPVDEDVVPQPMDSYSLSKLCMENIARAFALRFGPVSIHIMRIGAVIGPDEYHSAFARYINEPERWKVHGWSYTDARDFGQMCFLSVQSDSTGFQVFNATNDEITNYNSTMAFLKQQCPGVPFRREMGLREAPVTNRKMKELLGFVQEHRWQDELSIQ